MPGPIALVSFRTAKLNSDNLVAVDAADLAKEAGFPEFDNAVLKRDQLTVDALAIAHDQRIRVNCRGHKQQAGQNE